MKRMTHGEFRGLLLLIGLMMLVVIYAWFFKGDDSGGTIRKVNYTVDLQKDSVKNGYQQTAADSLLIENAARRAAALDSVRSARKSTRSGQDSPSNGKDTSKGSRKSSRQPKPTPAPTPSPLDRPV